MAYNRERESRLVRKTAQYTLSLAFLIALWAFGPRRRDWRRECGLLTQEGQARQWFFGLGAGLVSLAGYMTILTLMGQRQFLGIEWLDRSLDVLRYLAATPVVNALQDLLFFGFLFEILGRRALPTAFLFGLAHFFKIPKETVFDGNQILLGAEAVTSLGEGLRVIAGDGMRLFGLMTLGWVLARLRIRSGAIWLSMGLHAGWYVTRGVGRKISDDLAGDFEWIYGTDSFHDGLLGVVFLGVTYAVVAKFGPPVPPISQAS